MANTELTEEGVVLDATIYHTWPLIFPFIMLNESFRFYNVILVRADRFSCVSISTAENQHNAKICTFSVVRWFKMPVKYDKKNFKQTSFQQCSRKKKGGGEPIAFKSFVLILIMFPYWKGSLLTELLIFKKKWGANSVICNCWAVWLPETKSEIKKKVLIVS